MQTLTIADSGTWTLETMIGPPIAALMLLGLSYLAVLAFRWAERERGKSYGDRGPALIAAWVAIGAGVLVAMFTVLAFYPYNAEYHQWRNASGTVQQIDKRLINGGNGMEDKFVVRFDDGPQQFGCDDTRCASVRPGDQLTLSCKRVWQYTGTDGYDCRFVSTEAAS